MALLISRQNTPSIAYGFLIAIGSFTCGVGLFQLNHNERKGNLEPETAWVITNLQEAGNSNHYQKFNAVAIPIDSSGSSQNELSANIIVYYKHSLNKLPPSASLITSVQPTLPAPPLNPYQYNYRDYLLEKGINGQLFINEESDFSQLKAGSAASYSYLTPIKGFLSNNIVRYIKAEHQGIVRAMFLGDRAELEQERKLQYAQAGIMHILAVSGLHVGIVYLVLQWAFRFLPRRKKSSRLVQFLVIVSGLWLYVMITGGAASTTRAAIIFSLLSLGKLSSRQVNSLNSLAIAALLILLIDPHQLFGVGFQLSFSAVIGILTLEPRLAKYWPTQNKILRYIRSLFAVTIAAQLGTLPLTLYYFNTFPTYFIFTNLIAVPVAFIVICGTVVLNLLVWLPIVPEFVGWLIGQSLDFLQFWIALFNNLPLAQVFTLLSLTETFGLYAFFAAVIIWWYTYNKKYVWLAQAALLLVGFSLLNRQIIYRNQNSLTVYNIPNSTLIAWNQANDRLLYSSSTDTSKLNYAAGSHQIRLGNKPIRSEELRSLEDITCFSLGEEELLIVNGSELGDKQYDLPPIGNELHSKLAGSTYLLVVGQPSEEVVSQLSVGINQVIMDSSNPNYYKSKIETKVKFIHPTSELGAFILQPKPSQSSPNFY
jgi:competence protein ComEC